MSEIIGIKSIVRAVIIVYYVDHGEELQEALRIADEYLEQLKQQIIQEATG